MAQVQMPVGAGARRRQVGGTAGGGRPHAPRPWKPDRGAGGKVHHAADPAPLEGKPGVFGIVGCCSACGGGVDGRVQQYSGLGLRCAAACSSCLQLECLSSVELRRMSPRGTACASCQPEVCKWPAEGWTAPHMLVIVYDGTDAVPTDAVCGSVAACEFTHSMRSALLLPGPARQAQPVPRPAHAWAAAAAPAGRWLSRHVW